MSEKSIRESLEIIERSRQRLAIREQHLVGQALNSGNPGDIIKAQEAVQRITGGDSERKSMLIDPQEFLSGFGFKDKPMPMSYSLLWNMSKTSIMNSIHKTRINQVANFAQPQQDKYSVGYEIRKKSYSMYSEDNVQKLSKEEEREIAEIIEFLEVGCIEENFHNDDFEDFLRKITRDSLIYDQMTFEIVRTRNGKLYEFFATDASSFRLSESYGKKDYDEKPKQKKFGYFPDYVQIYQNTVESEYYPWELCFGVRNPHTNLSLNGYGVSELEELSSTITSLLWGEDYNRRFFKQGSAPKGILKVSGNVNETKLREFKQQWNATMRGVQNAWKTPVLEADKMEWIDLQRTNRDMEFMNWLEFLIKIACAIYSIDPSEINFPFNGSPGEKIMFSGNNESRIKYSKDKGLAPILRFLQKKINKYLIRQINPKYEFVFKGIDSTNPKDELELDEKAVKVFNTVNEIRVRRGLQPIDGGDIILDSTYMQQLMTQQQNEQMEQEQGGMGGEEEENPILAAQQEEEDNPIMKGFNEYMTKTLLT